jgi:hypothetical protein
VTFYNVISGILFFTGCQAFLARLGTAQVWFAATLLLIILNEAVSTSDLLERRMPGVAEIDYTLGMKLLDFTTFGVLIWALLVLSPKVNTLEVDVSTSLWGVDRPSAYWLLLTVYWVLTSIWNELGGQSKKARWKPAYIKFTRFRFVPFLLLTFIGCGSSFASTPAWPGVLACVLAVAFLVLKFFGRVPPPNPAPAHGRSAPPSAGEG